MHRNNLSSVLLVTAALLSTSAAAEAGPITIVVNGVTGSGSGLPGSVDLSDGSSIILPFAGQLTNATLSLNTSGLAPAPFGSWTAEVNGVALGYAFRSSLAPSLSFDLTSQMLSAANRDGFVEARFFVGGSANVLTVNSLQLNGQVNGVAVPEPGTLALLGLGLFGAAFGVRRRRRG